jgi:hypothetical protein
LGGVVRGLGADGRDVAQDRAELGGAGAAERQHATARPSRAAPARVRRSSLLRRSDAPARIAIRPSRWSGSMVRPRVVRSRTRSSARAWIVMGPWCDSLNRMENWVVRSPVEARARS